MADTIRFDVDVQGVADVDAMLRRLEGQLSDWGQSMSNVGEDYKQYYESVPFASRGSIYGQTWPDLHPGYKSWKADYYPGKPIMVLTGALQKGFYFVSTNEMIRLSNSVSYFEKHQFGIDVPQRVIMALTEERKRTATDIIKRDLDSKVRGL